MPQQTSQLVVNELALCRDICDIVDGREEDRCVHQVKTRRNSARTDGNSLSPNPEQINNAGETSSNKQARARLTSIPVAALCAARHQPIFAFHCPNPLSLQYAIAVYKHRLQTTHILCSHTPHDSAVLEARAPETKLRHNRL